MRRLSEAGSRELVWMVRGCGNSEHELWAGDEVVAALRWRGNSVAVAETADVHLSFERPVLRRSPVSIRALESGAEIAAFGSGWTGAGTLETSRGRRIHWSPANFWRTRWAWRQGDRTPLVHFESKQRLVKVEGRVRAEEAALALPELDLLMILGWYLTVMRAKDGTADAVAATAGTAGS